MNQTQIIAASSFATGVVLTQLRANRKLKKALIANSVMWAQFSKTDYETGVKFGTEIAKTLLGDETPSTVPSDKS